MDIRNCLFKNRSYTPIPLALLVIFFSRPVLPCFWLGLASVLIGECIRIWVVRYAGGGTRSIKVRAPVLCFTGPYAYVRNPLYIGNLFIFTGIVLTAGAPNIWVMLAITWLFFITQYALIIGLEEETLGRVFGDAYNNYRENVPRLLPRLFPWPTTDARHPMSLTATLSTEKRTLQTIMLILLLLLIRQQSS